MKKKKVQSVHYKIHLRAMLKFFEVEFWNNASPAYAFRNPPAGGDYCASAPGTSTICIITIFAVRAMARFESNRSRGIRINVMKLYAHDYGRNATGLK